MAGAGSGAVVDVGVGVGAGTGAGAWPLSVCHSRCSQEDEERSVMVEMGDREVVVQRPCRCPKNEVGTQHARVAAIGRSLGG